MLSASASRYARRAVVGALVSACLSLSGCGGAEPAAAPTPEVTRTETQVTRYLPLPSDFVYTYDTYSDGQLIGSLWMQITHPRAMRVDLKMGSRVTHLQLEDAGVRDIVGGWVLKAPLRVGATFPGKTGEVKISRMGVAIETKAGSFTDCLETQEEALGAEASSKITTLFCPDVGIVRMDIMAQQGNELIEEQILLRSFAKRVDINALAE